MQRVRLSFVLSLCLALTVSGGCSDAQAGDRRTIVFASASLTEPFTRLAELFEDTHPGAAVELHFAGTPQLVVQLREGAHADVFAAADSTNMDRVAASRPTIGTPRTFATNALTIVVERGNPHGVTGLADLARDGLKVALCGPEVPAGRYARLALKRAGITVRSVSDEPSVRALRSKVELGEIDAGIVYATDVPSGASRRVDRVEMPDDHNVTAAYPIAVLTERDGRAFVDFVCSNEGARVLESFGFGVP